MKTDSYTVEITYTSARRIVAEEVGSLAEAKSVARSAWDKHPGMCVAITGDDGQAITATQTHGTGMLWR